MSGGHGAAHYAHEKRKRKRERRQEEEEMTRYNRDDNQNEWEYKIVRSQTGAFKTYDKVERIKAEEAIAGWVMVEKFDDNRVRFKRPVSAQRKDAQLPPGIDPYRTTIGMSEAGLAFTIMGVLAAIGGIIAIVVSIAN